MTYNELLNQKEWWSKCNEILQRDHFTCKDCGSVGFHNGGSFIKLDYIEELDSILKGWLFNGTIFSKFWSNIPYNTPYPISNIPFQAECCDEDLTVYDLNLFNTRNSLFKDISSTPEKIIAASREKIEHLNATAYSFIGYQTAYLATKWNPIYWDTACLIVNSGSLENDDIEYDESASSISYTFKSSR